MKVKDFLENIDKIAQDYEISRIQTLEALEAGLISGCKKNYQVKSCYVSFEKDYSEFFLYRQYLVVDELNNSNDKIKEESDKINFKKINFIKLKEAQQIKKDIKLGEMLQILVNPNEFNFYASKDFKNKFHEEIMKRRRENIFNFFKRYEKKIISAEVVAINENSFTLQLEKNINVFLLKKETLLNDNFYLNERIQVYVVKVQDKNKMPEIFISRTNENFVREIFKEFIPEIQEGIVQIVGMSRAPSIKTKIGLLSKNNRVDPIGSCIGEKGSRIQSILNILNGEKINLFLWSDDIKELITNSLKPAQINEIVFVDKNRKEVLVSVSPEQAPLVIGKSGINLRLASKAINWNIKVEILSEKK
ncbi:MAG: transcription elongation factor [Candidatus Phytoplasma cynodontis]|nr:MAG: transcription elongation factor [Candidatus Phytoplasma cynodontis]